MNQLLLCLIVLFISQYVLAAFPKPVVNSLQTSSLYQQPILLKADEQRTGRKLTCKEKLLFKLLQHHFKKEQKEDCKFDNVATFGGFLLGFCLSIIGVGIAYLLPKNKTLRTWTWIGFGVSAILFLLIFVVY